MGLTLNPKNQVQMKGTENPRFMPFTFTTANAEGTRLDCGGHQCGNNFDMELFLQLGSSMTPACVFQNDIQ